MPPHIFRHCVMGSAWRVSSILQTEFSWALFHTCMCFLVYLKHITVNTNWLPLFKCATFLYTFRVKASFGNSIALLSIAWYQDESGAHKNNQVCWCKFSSVCCTRNKLTIASIQLHKKSTNGNFIGAFSLCAGVCWSWERSEGPGSTAMPSGSRYPYQLQGCIFIMWRNNHLQSCISRYCITVASNFFCFQHAFYSGLFKLLLLFGVSRFRFKTSQKN